MKINLRLVSAVVLLFASSLVNRCACKWGGVLPPGYALVDGEAIDVTDKVIQVTSPKGTQYYAFDDPQGSPMYIRDRAESGWHFIVFDDPYNQDPGGGHFIVLQRMKGLKGGGDGKIIYEVFLLTMESSVTAHVDGFDIQEFDYYKDEEEKSIRKDTDYMQGATHMSGMVPPGLMRNKRSLMNYNERMMQCELYPVEVTEAVRDDFTNCKDGCLND